MQINETITGVISTYVGSSPETFTVQLVSALLIIIASGVIALVFNFIMDKVIHRLTSKTTSDLDDLLIGVLRRPIFNTFILAGGYVALFFFGYSYDITGILGKLIISIALIMWLLTSFKLNSILFERVFSKVARKTDSQLDDELLPLIKKLVDLALAIIVVMIIVGSVFGYNITPIIASAGILGFVVAFAAQDAISQLFGGLSIYLDKPFRKGDRIELDSGELGIVKEVGLRSTRIMNFYNNMIIIPNSKIANSKIVNYTSPHSKMMFTVKVGVAYGSDIEKVKKVLLGIAGKIDEVAKDPSPSVRFDNHGDSSLDFVLVLWVAAPKDKFTVIDKANVMIDREFRKNKIDIPFPTRTIIQAK